MLGATMATISEREAQGQALDLTSIAFIDTCSTSDVATRNWVAAQGKQHFLFKKRVNKMVLATLAGKTTATNDVFFDADLAGSEGVTSCKFRVALTDDVHADPLLAFWDSLP